MLNKSELLPLIDEREASRSYTETPGRFNDQLYFCFFYKHLIRLIELRQLEHYISYY